MSYSGSSIGWRCVEIAPRGFSDASKTLATIVSLWVQVCMPTKIMFLS